VIIVLQIWHREDVPHFYHNSCRYILSLRSNFPFVFYTWT
jgi:hypothetical protein